MGARVQHGGARVVAWLRAGAAERCATLAAPRALPVARQRAAWVTLQDLYDSSEFTFYYIFSSLNIFNSVDILLQSYLKYIIVII